MANLFHLVKANIVKKVPVYRGGWPGEKDRGPGPRIVIKGLRELRRILRARVTRQAFSAALPKSSAIDIGPVNDVGIGKYKRFNLIQS